MLKRFVLTFLLLTPTITISGGLTDKSKSFVENLGKEVVEKVSNDVVRVIEGNQAPVAAGGDSVTAWTNSDWNATAIGSTGLTYKAIAPRPGTSAFASERYISKDEVHVAVID